MKLGALLVELYEAGDEPAISALLDIFQRVRIAYGLWQGMKRIYKLAELRHDAAMFGVLAARFDLLQADYSERARVTEISVGTFHYLSRRAWRYLRELGRAVPEIYPWFAAQVLKNYPARFSFHQSWVANQIWARGELVGAGSSLGIRSPSQELEKRAYPEAWKLSPDPLLRLLEDAENDTVAEFAIRSLKKDHPDALRSADPRWIARLGQKSLGVVHALIVELLNETPELHATKLRALGLHELVLSLLGSSNAAARKYAIEYANTYAADMPISDLVRWVGSGAAEVRTFAAARLSSKTAREIGFEALVRLLDVKETAQLAMSKIREQYSAKDVTSDIFVALYLAGQNQRKFVTEFFESAKSRPPARYYLAVLDDARADYRAREQATRALATYSGREIGREAIEKALFDPKLSDWIGPLLRGGILSGEDIRVEWVKELLGHPRFRPLAIELLANVKIIEPSRLEVSWLLEQAASADETIAHFAHHHLLAHYRPAAIAPKVGALWAMAVKGSEPLRRFAASFLETHHPALGPTKNESRALGIKAQLSHADYALSFVEPLFFDERPDVRRFAALIAKEEMLRWNAPELLFRLAGSPHRELRAAAGELLLSIGEADADVSRVPPPEWLTADAVFALAESHEKTAREVALVLIRRHYERLGGQSRLAWLMESPDREVRLFAVRLLFEKHRKTAFRADSELIHFLRSTLFGLPPGRMERRELSAELLPGRPLSASIAKRRLIEVVRDLAVEEREFARLVQPVLGELSRSVAKGEWQSCVAALAWIERAHPDLKISAGTE